jgi:hypothetical protein
MITFKCCPILGFSWTVNIPPIFKKEKRTVAPPTKEKRNDFNRKY